MVKRVSISIFFFVFVFSFCLADGFLPGTLVVTPQGFVPIQELSVGDVVICRDTHYKFKQEKIIAVSRNLVHEYIQIQIGDEIIVTDLEQCFYDYVHNEWVSAHNLVPFQSSISQEPISVLQPIQAPIELYCLSVENHHNFLITQYVVCVHNFYPAAHMFSTQTARVATGVIGCFGVRVRECPNWRTDPFAFADFMQKQQEAEAWAAYNKQLAEDKKNKALRDADKDKKKGGKEPNNKDDKPIKVNNMEEFFATTEFGRKLNKCVQKINRRIQGEAVYKVTKDVEGLEKGWLFHLDKLHKDHLEIYDKLGIHLGSRSLSGQIYKEAVKNRCIPV